MGTRRSGGVQGHPDPDRISRPRIDPAGTLFERTAAYQRFGIQTNPDPLGPEDLYTKALIQEQGFDGLPHVVSSTELDRYVNAGEPELFRGLSAAGHAHELRFGALFVGRGTLGGGIYAAGGADRLPHASAYAQDPGGVVVRLTLKAGTRAADAAVVTDEMRGERRRAMPYGAVETATHAAVYARTELASVYAAHLGYDVLVDAVNGIWLVLNRTALRVQREDLRP